MKSTQEQYPWRATVRTALQVVLALAIVVPAILGALDSSGLAAYLGSAWPKLTAAGAFVVAVSAALARIMAIPQVNAWLRLLGLGTDPATAPDQPAAPVAQEAAPKSGSAV